MDRLVLKNTGTEYAYVNDMGVGVAPGEDLDLIPNYRDEDVLESVDLQSAMQGDLEVWLNDVTPMTYNDVINYLTKLTRYDVIDFNYISSEDSTTDVTGSEIEELTDGSDTSLHNHDNRYYTQTQLQTPGQSTVDWGNIANAPTGNNIIEQNGQLYVFDPTRNKTLSVYEQDYLFSSKAANGRFLNVGDNFGFDVGYASPYNGTIVRFGISSSNTISKTVEVRKNNTTILYSHTMVSNIEIVNSLNIDVVQGDLIQIFVNGGGPALRRVVVNVYLRERI